MSGEVSFWLLTGVSLSPSNNNYVLDLGPGYPAYPGKWGIFFGYTEDNEDNGDIGGLNMCTALKQYSQKL